MSDVIAKVISQKGHCHNGHKVGDEFVVGPKTPEGVCAFAYYAIFPFASVLRYGGKFPWSKDENKVTVACPDGDNPVEFELTRTSTT